MASSFGSQIGSFIVQVSANFLLSRLAARDGARLDNLEAAGGEYGVAMPRAFGEKVRLAGASIVQADIKETKHKAGGKTAAVVAGAVGGAVQGFMVGGPVGAVIGAAVGGLLGFATPDVYYYTYSDTFALFLVDRAGDDPIEGIEKVWAAGKLIFKASQSTVVSETFDVDGRLISRKYKKNKYFKSLTLYTGHGDQPLDPILAAKVGETAGFVHSAILVFEDLQLADFGNSVPEPEHLLLIESGQSLAKAAGRICAAAGIDQLRDMSSTALAGFILRGYALTSETTCWDALKPLMPVFGVDAAEVSGQIRFYKRSQTMRATIPIEDMGGHAYGEEVAEPIRFKRGGDLDLPQELALTFIDPARDYQANTATAPRSGGNSASNVAVTLSLVMTADEGASTAALMLWDECLGRTAVSFSLTDRWHGLATGLAYGLPVAGEILPYRITLRRRGGNGIIEVEALSDESVTYTANVAGSSGALPDDPSTLFADTKLMLLDMPIVEDAHDDFGYYVVMAAAAPGWPRARIQGSSNGVDFVDMLDSHIDCPAMGDVTGTLAAGSTTGLDDTLDSATVLTVVLLHDGMELESATDADLDGFANFAFVGKDGLGEYLQFKTATKVGTATWELTDLRRGRKGTDHAIATHAADEQFCLVGAGGVFRIVYGDATNWGDPLYFRGVTLHQDEEDGEIVGPFANSGEGKRPYSPVNVDDTWAGNDLTGTFDARSRMNIGGLGVDDNFEFDVEITNAVPVRSMTVMAETFNYSAVDQAADGLTPGTIIEGRVRQTSDVNDGRWREFTIYGPVATLFDSTLVSFDSTIITMDKV